MKFRFALMLFAVAVFAASATEPVTLNLWPGTPPGETKQLPPEADQTKDTDKLIAGRRIIKLGNVSTPQITVYKPEASKDTGAAVVIAPGGGHYILAYDLEGTEVAEWLNTLGVTGIVLKYRVPFRDPEKRWGAAVQDAQRAMSLVRSHAKEWGIDPQRVGICGFSAGGQTAGLTSIFTERTYESVDAADTFSTRPDFAMLIYTGGMVERGSTELNDYVKVGEGVPPLFMAHAFDDRVDLHNSLNLAAEWKRVGVPVELHAYSEGGHGYGLRETEQPVTTWHHRAADWMKVNGWLEK